MFIRTLIKKGFILAALEKFRKKKNKYMPMELVRELFYNKYKRMLERK